LAVEAVLDDDGLLTITGTPEDDTILIRENREGEIIVETRDPDDRFEPFAGVEQIVVNSLAGDDTVRYHVRQAGSIPAEFNLGEGEDELSAHVGVARGDAPGPSAELTVNAGAGDDVVSVVAWLHSGRKFRDDTGPSSLSFTADLGAGNDRLRVGGHGVAQASFDVTAGDGDDEVGIGMLLPAVQRVRDAVAATMLEVNADLGAGNDKLRIHGHGATETTIDVTGGADDDDVRISLVPPFHRFFSSNADAKASIAVDLGAGDDELSVSALGVKGVDLDVLAGNGDDEIQIGLLLPAIRPVEGSSANVAVDLGPGADRLALKVRGYETVETDISGDEDDGDEVYLDIKPGPRPRPIPLPGPTQPRPIPSPRPIDPILPPGRGRG
jgi:hypothetical protein